MPAERYHSLCSITHEGKTFQFKVQQGSAGEAIERAIKNRFGIPPAEKILLVDTDDCVCPVDHTLSTGQYTLVVGHQPLVDSKNSASFTCLCKQVGWTVTGNPTLAVYCHCNSCQTYSGGNYGTLVAVSPKQVQICAGKDQICEYESAPKKIRSSCKKCGSMIYNILPDGSYVLPVPTIVAKAGHVGEMFRPTMHIFYAERVVDVKDELPKHEGWPTDKVADPKPVSRAAAEAPFGDKDTIEFTCLCKSVGWQAEGKPNLSVYCHCDSCQRYSGGDFATLSVVAPNKFKVTKGKTLVNEYESAPKKIRASCKKCYSKLYNILPDGNIAVPVPTIMCKGGSAAEAYKPTMHIFYKERVSDVHDSLVKHQGWPA
eukprot:gb/GEZN01009475.1/.p1 GENE.gb/GEZN01009475.1/~~gb/GEZN01009475.1/.p1  ORF type:complete len:372 (-),score=38.40 gb/GEZN01009475.1/:180-1295(-)